MVDGKIKREPSYEIQANLIMILLFFLRREDKENQKCLGEAGPCQPPIQQHYIDLKENTQKFKLCYIHIRWCIGESSSV